MSDVKKNSHPLKRMRVAARIFIIVTLLLFVLSACQPAAPEADLVPPTATTNTEPTLTPTPIPAPTPTVISKPTQQTCLQLAGKVERVKIKSELLKAPFYFSVYTPPCYQSGAVEKYPVLFLLHGQNMDDTFWLGLGVATIADTAIKTGQRPFLMVFPYEEKNFDPIPDSKFGDAVIKELLPWVESHYSVCIERSCRAIGGVSRGGGWAVRLALRNFDTFGAVGGHSMGLMPGDWWQAEHLLETHTVDEFPPIYLDRGLDDYLAKDIDYFESVLTRNHIPHEFHISPGEHETAYWQEHVQEYMQWYMAGWK
jgi:enterochelin esterase-like enzyme